MLERKRGRSSSATSGASRTCRSSRARSSSSIPVKEHIAVREANRLGVPVVAVADTNADPA
jgi:hypothetical protein